MALTGREAKTDTNVPTLGHMIKAINEAATVLGDFITTVMDDIGKFIEQTGEFLFDYADKSWDLKEISFATSALGAMIAQIVSLIDWTFNRIDETTLAAEKIKLKTDEKYADQIINKIEEKANIDSFNSLIEDSINNKQMPTTESLTTLAKDNVNTALASVQGVSLT